MSKFDDQFSEPNYFSNGAYVISGKMSREDAAEMISEVLLSDEDIEEPIDPSSLKADRIRYGFAPSDVEDMTGEACWYTGARGRGSMPVWVYE